MPSPNRKLKTRLHFNRINMQRGKPEVWTASNSKACNQARKIVIVKDGNIIAETVFDPQAKQPRAYFLVHGSVSYIGETAIVEV